MGTRAKSAGLFASVVLLIVTMLGVTPSTSYAGAAVDIVVVGGPAAVSDEIVGILGSCTNGEVRRLEGPNRFATAAQVSQDTFPTPGIDVVYITRADIFPDALSAVPKATLTGGPILLVNPTGSINGATASELSRLKPKSIVILGGVAAVSSSVESALGAYTSGSVTRIGGANRYETSADVSASQFSPGVEAVYVARGDDFPDAMVGGIRAALDDAPVLLTTATSIPSAIAAELNRLDPKSITVVGGTAVIPDSLKNQLNAYTAGPVDRIAGPNRYATAAEISQSAFPDPATVDRIYVGLGTTFADVLPAGVAAGITESPLLLVSPTGVPSPTAAEILRLTGKTCQGSQNTAPVAANDSYSTDEDTPLTTGDVTANDADANGNALSVVAHDATSTQGGTVVDNGDGTFDYTPPADFNGSDSFDYTITDGTLTDSATVSITVNPVNDDPVALDDTESTPEDTPLTTGDVTANDTDVDGDPLTVSSVDATSTEGGSVVDNGDGTFDYTPPTDFTGVDTFGYEVSDGNGGTDTATVTVTVGPLNDPPVANDDAIVVAEGGTATTLDPSGTDVRANDTDVEDGTPTGDVALVADVTNGSLTLNADGTFSYTHDGSETTTDSFTYTVEDSNGAVSNVATVAITVTPDNDAPVANDDAFSTDEDNVLNVGAGQVQLNDTDAEDGTPSGDVNLVTDASDGSLNLNLDGSFDYTPDPNFNGTDSFTYTVDDSAGALSNTATVTITVDSVNDLPTAGDSSETTDEDTPLLNAVFNASDVEDAASDLTYSINQPTDGAVTDNGDGTYDFDPDGDFDDLEDGESTDVMFTYTVTDTDLGVSPASGTVTITVTGVNDGDPVIVTKSVEAREILYRVNSGGAVVAAVDGGPDWSADSPASPSPWINPGYTAHKSASNTDTIDMTSLPTQAQIQALFNVERWDEPAAPEMGYSFPVDVGETVEVRLYFAETHDPIDQAGERIFDVTIDGSPFLTDFDQWVEAGNTQNVAFVESTTIVSDGVVNIDFTHDTENPAIKAVEIIRIGDSLPEPGGTFTYTVTIDNPTPNETVEVTAVTDSVVGDIAPFCDATFPAVITEGTSINCVFTDVHTAVGDYMNTVTVAATGFSSGENASATSNEVTASVTAVPGLASAKVAITEGGGIGASTFTSGALSIENLSTGRDITSVTIDIGTGLFPDAVFDPIGTAGDATGKCFTPDAGATATGLVVPGDPCTDPFSSPHLGDPLDGYDVVTIDFTDFNPGETFSFSVDIDPNNIKGAPSTGFAGAVSGLELAGAVVTVEYSDASVFTSSLWRDAGDSPGGGVAFVTDPAIPTPAIDGVTGVTLGSVDSNDPTRLGATVVDAAQTVTVSGPVGANVELLVIEGGLTTGAAYMVEEFDANEALSAANMTVYTDVIGGSGTVDIPITLTNTLPDGGYNMITAVIEDGGRTGLASEDLVLILSEDAYLSGGGSGSSVTTDGDANGAFDYDPIEVTVTVPSTGTYDVDIVEGPVTTTSPYTMLGYEVDLTFSAPAPSDADPYTITFELDTSLTGGATTTDVFKDGVLVPSCLAGGTADPDPCVESVSTDGDGDLVITVLSTTASQWNFANDVPPNDPPAFDQDIGDQTNDEGDAVSLDSPATDPDNGPNPSLFYSATGLPTGLSINDTTGQITGTIAAGASAGSPYAVTISVTDGAASVDDMFTWTVGSGPVAPTALYRVNVGGPEYPAADGSLPVWAADTGSPDSTYLSEGGANFYDSSAGSAYTVVTGDPSIPGSVPDEIFDTERYDVSAAPDMLWQFPVTAGNAYEVRLLFAELFNGIDNDPNPGERIFDVSVDGVVPAVFDDIDQYAIAGPGGGFMLSTTVIADDANLDLQFIHGVENPALKGIEILAVDSLSASPPSHDFGTVDVGSTGSQTFTITNNSATTAIETTQISIVGDAAFTLADVPPYPNTINPGDSYTFDVNFDPTGSGLVSAYVEILNTQATVNIALIGEGVDGAATVLYRVNGGGPLTSAIDGGPDWEQDVDGTSTYRTGGAIDTSGGNTNNTWAPAPYTPASTTPNAVFGTEAYGDMNWNFPVTPGTAVEVRIFMQNTWTGSDEPGQRVFDINIDGVLEWDDIDLADDHGQLTAVMYTKVLTADTDGVDIDFITGSANNPLVNAIEIVSSEPQPGVLALSPLSYDFGTQIIGGVGATTMTLTNLGGPGDQDITIADTDVTLDNGDFSHSFTSTVVLSPGDSTQFDVNFIPGSAGAQSATLTVDHDGTNGQLTATFDGNGASTIPPGFSNSELAGAASGSLTSLQFGPDDRLYVSQQDGLIRVYTIVRNGEDDYAVTDTELITEVQDIVNHTDTGGSSTTTNRQVTGLLVTGTALNPVLYVSSADSNISVGNDSNLDTNSGTISRLTWNGSTWDHVQMVRGLPRSEENHAPNGMALSADGNTLYLMQGGHTNMGAPGNKFSATPEYALSAALLSIDLAAIDAMPTSTDDDGQNYKYNLPTLDDPTRPNTSETVDINGQTVFVDEGDPFGGNDGLNQAAWIAGGPVEVYAPGFRNSYDVVRTQADKLYTIDNGPNGGWGGIVVNEGPGGVCTGAFNDNDSAGYGDGLHYISGPGYYGGHPNPVRGNPTGAMLYKYLGATSTLDGSYVPNPYDFGTDLAIPVPSANPIECEYVSPIEGNDLVVIGASTNGITEYTASNFGGEMVGDLLAASFDDMIYRFELNAAGDDLVGSGAIFSGFGGNPLDVTAQGDSDIFPGTVWVAMHGAKTIEVFEPNDYDGGGEPCDGLPGSIDEDGDGFTNDDELDNGTDPCSAGSQPDDFDGDNVSDLNDTDDDNDGILDPDDPFAIDATNGAANTLPASCGLDSDTSTPTCLHFASGDRSGTILDLGFTGLMTNGSLDWRGPYPGEITEGGIAEAFGLNGVTAGDAWTSVNTQDHGFQFGFEPGTDPFVLHTQVVDPLSGTPDTFMSAGLQFGPGDQDNYVKFVVSKYGNGGGDIGVQLGKEIDGAFASTNTPAAGVAGSPKVIDLWLDVDPTTGIVDATFSIDGGTVTSGGSTTVDLLEGWFDDPLALGLISTSTGASPFEVTWNLLEAWAPSTVSGTPEAQIDISGGSTFSDNSMDITNASTGTVEITNVSFDLSTAILQNVVFDPTDGSPAGDTVGKCLEINTEGGSGFVDPADPCVDPFSSPSQDGYYVMDMAFDDFDPGETVEFSVDIDPTSIKGLSGSSEPGSIGGFELTGATVTVDFSDGSTYTGTLIGDGSGDDSHATVRAGLPGAPTSISAVQVAPLPTIVGTADHTIKVEGPEGAEVTLFEVEGEMLSADPADFPFEANKALVGGYTTQQGTIAGGEVLFPVTLAATSAEGGLNYFLAVLTDGASGPAGDAPSQRLILEYDDASGGTVVHRVNAGGGVITDPPNDWDADTGAVNHPALVGAGDNKTGSFDGSHGATVPGGTPLEVWDTERYSTTTSLNWSFGVNTGAEYLLRLYVNNGYSGTQTPGTRQFDISVEGVTVIEDLDLAASFGHQIGGVVTVRVLPADVADGLLTFSLSHGTIENPLINAIEVIQMP